MKSPEGSIMNGLLPNLKSVLVIPIMCLELGLTMPYLDSRKGDGNHFDFKTRVEWVDDSDLRSHFAINSFEVRVIPQCRFGECPRTS